MTGLCGHVRTHMGVTRHVVMLRPCIVGVSGSVPRHVIGGALVSCASMCGPWHAMIT